MQSRLLFTLLTALLTLGVAVDGLAQRFTASYVAPGGRPDELVVCGDSDLAIYRLELRAGQPFASDVEVTVELFDGMRAVGFDASNSSPGVSLVSLADPTRPVISLPDLIPTASGRSADFGLILQARCGILDTINRHDDQGGTAAIQVIDQLNISYNDLGTTPRSETRPVAPYLAAISFPVFGITDQLAYSPFRVGDRVTRTITIANGSFRGYADSVRYVVRQGAGASIEAMRINGTDRAFAKTVDAAGDTVITVLLAGSDFTANLNGATLGNSDGRFDAEESLSIEEDLYISTCSSNRLSSHRVLFGCDQSFCTETVIQSDLPIGSGQPSLQVTRATPFPDMEAGYCQAGELTVWVHNLGRETDPGFGQARNLAVSGAFSDFGATLAAGGYVITDVEVAGVAIPSPPLVVRLDDVAAFTSDPDGPGQGLEDHDGDGVFDDLAILDSFPMRIFFELDCTTLNDDGPADDCANDATTVFQAFAYYDDPCARRLDGREESLYSPRNILDDHEQRTQPDAFALGAPFQVELEFGRLVFDFANSCSPNAELRVYVDLPRGITVDAATSAIRRSESSPSFPLRGVSQVGNRAMISFDPSSEAVLNGQYIVQLGLQAGCDAALGETILPTTVAYYCPDCDCEHTWICEDIVGPWVHKTAPPCPVDSLYACPQGVSASAFTIDRTTLGFADADFTTPFPEASANTKVAIPADSVLIQIDGVAGDAVVTDSLGLVLHYFSPNDELDTAGLFLLGGGTMEWYDGTAWQLCNLTPTPHTLANDTTETWQYFDLSACLTDAGWAVQPGDSIRFNGTFEINPLGPILDSYEFVEDLRGGFYAVEGGVRTECDQFGDTFRVGKPLTTLGVPSNSSYPKGCAPTELDFRLSVVNRGYVDEFGPEHRRAPRLDSVVVEFDTAILSAFDSLNVELIVEGHPTMGSLPFATRPLTDFPDGRYLLVLDTLDYSSTLVSNASLLYSLRVSFTPNCSSIRSSSTDDAFYPMRALPYYRNRYYARDIGTGSRVDTVAEDLPFTMTYEDPAVLALDVISAPYQRLTTDSSFVDLEVCNTSTRSRAGRSWLTFNDTTTLAVEQAILLDDPTNPVELTIEPYTGGHFINMPGLERVSGAAASSQVCNLVRLKVRTVGCGVNGVRFATGWSCENTVPAGWTPAEDQACIDDFGLAEFEPIAPFLEADLISEPTAPSDLCAPITLTFQVNNAQPGTAYDVLSRFYVPEGLTYVAGSAEVEYPADPGADMFQPTVGDPVATPATVRGFGLEFSDLSSVHPYLDQAGLRGFDATNPSDSNRFELRLTFETSCEYRSGSIVFFETEGDEGCGDRTNFASSETSALRIVGATPDGSHGYDIGLAEGVRISTSNATSPISVFAINTGTDAADADDAFEITIPEGYSYEPASSAASLPVGYAIGEPTQTSMDAVTKLEWPMPLGLSAGERFEFTFRVRPTSATCDEAEQIGLAALRYVTAACVSLGTTCRIPTDITLGGARLEDLPVGDEFVSNILNNTSTCDGATSEVLDLRVELSASSFTLSGSPLELALYQDTNGDGIAGAGDLLLDQQSVATTAGATSALYSFGGSLERNQLSGLILLVDSTGQSLCSPQQIPVALPQLDNAAALDLYTLCSNTDAPLVLGDATCNAAVDVDFSWTTVPSGLEILLSDSTAAAPTLTVPLDYAGPDTVLFVLTSDRLGVGATSDTVTLVLAPGVELGQQPTVFIDYRETIVLTPDVQQGEAPFSYRWTPAATLNSGTDPQPVASQREDQVYTLEVTDRFGCSATITQLVRVNNPLQPTLNVRDTSICPDTTLELVAGGGANYAWRQLAGNPPQGGLNVEDQAAVIFNPAGGVGEYNFEVVVTDPAFPEYDSTLSVRVVVDPDANCQGRCDIPTLISELTLETPCGEATGAVTLAYDDVLADYETVWTTTAGDTLAQNVTMVADLPVGAYRFRGVNRADTICQFELIAYVSSSDAPIGDVTVSDARCGQSDGEVIVGPASLTVVWPDGVIASQRSDLAAGTYRVAVFEGDPECRRYQQVTVGESGGLVVEATVTQLPACGGSDGRVEINVIGGLSSYDYVWSANARTANNRESNLLAAGVYTVIVTDRATGCTGEKSFVLANNVAGASISMLAVTDETCPAAADGALDFAIGFDGAFAGPADTLLISPSGDTLAAGTATLAADEYAILVLDANGCLAGGMTAVVAPATPIRGDVTVSEVCGLDNGNFSFLVREARQPLALAFSDGRVATGLSLGDFGPGGYTATLTDSLGCAVNYDFSVDQCGPCDFAGGAAVDTVRATAACDGTAAVCLSGVADRTNDLSIFANGIRYLDGLSPCDYQRGRLAYLVSGVDFRTPQNLTWAVTGVAFTGTATSVQELVDFFTASDPLGEWTYTASTGTIAGGRRGSVYDVLRYQRDGSSIVNVIAPNERIEPFGMAISLPPGFHTIVVIDSVARCADTIYADIVCPSVDSISVAVVVGDVEEFCVSALDLNGPIVSLTDVCPDSTFASYAMLSDSCVAVFGDVVGTQRGCWVACDSSGVCDTTFVTVTVLPADGKIIVYDTIFINETAGYCGQPGVDYRTASIVRSPDSLVEASLDSLLPCANYRGLVLGSDTLLVASTRSDGIVDTVCVLITVVPYDGLPEAVNDSLCTQRNTPVRINVLANDQVFGGVASFRIVNAPAIVDGRVFINSDNTVTFEPATDVCARDVSFTYEVCNPTADTCATAEVVVCIECDELIVFTAVSPNNDGINDVFFVAKIEEFPNNELRIYNRWGNLVHQETQYRNTWRGTYDGSPLPDGPYFYILDVTDGGVETTYRGYLELMR